MALNRSLGALAAIFGGGLVCGAVLAVLIVADVDRGRSPPAGPPSVTSAPPSPNPSPAPSAPASANPARPAAAALPAAAQAAVDERIARLQTQLGITPAQLGLWSAFAAAMRDNAATTDALFARRAAAVTTMSAVENMRSYAGIAHAYADNTQRLATAFDSLYASLSETQRRAADNLFREQAAAAAKPQSER